MEHPRITIRQSSLYDNALQRRADAKPYTEEERIEAFNSLKENWKNNEEKMLTAISEITKLPWNEKEIVVYLTTEGVQPYSDPITMTPGCNMHDLTHDLTHEFIHRILSEPENWPAIKNNWQALMEKYKDESKVCKSHVPVLAIHAEILEKHFGNEALENERKRVTSQDYIRAWEIVKNEGYQNIILELIEHSI